MGAAAKYFEWVLPCVRRPYKSARWCFHDVASGGRTGSFNQV